MKTILKVVFVLVLVTTLLGQPAHVSAACPTTITWSGIDWKISDWAMTSDEFMPGFVFDPCNVTKDSSGRLVLTLVKVKDAKSGKYVWKGAEISTPYTRSFGTYYVQVYSGLNTTTMPPSAVFGFFPYKGAKYDGTNEIDIEYSQWGNSKADNWNYTVYPAKSYGSKSSKTFGYSTDSSTTHSFVWDSKSINFQSFTGRKTPPFTGTPFASWNYAPKNYKDNIPQTSIPLLINLWAHKSAEMGSATKYTVVLSKVVTP